MSTPHSELGRQLQALFGGLDTGADFDARLVARLRAESHGDATEQAMGALQKERARHRRAVAELESRGRSMLHLLTLDALGVAILLVLAAVAAWPHIGENMVAIWRRDGAYLMVMLGLTIAAIPLVGMWAERTRRAVSLI